MQHHPRQHPPGLKARPDDSRSGLLKALVLVLSFTLFGGVLSWNQDIIIATITGTQGQAIAELREQNRLLQNEVERLKAVAKDPSSLSSARMAELIQRINTIEHHQSALIEVLKGQQPLKLKQSSLEGIEHSKQPDHTKLGLLHERLGEIENTHITLAKSLMERSERNTRILTVLLASVSDRLVSPPLFGKAPTKSARHLGGPFIPLATSTGNTAGFKPNYPEVVTTAIETMHNHAQIYNTLINLPMARPLMGESQYISGFGSRTDPFTRQPAFHAGIDLAQYPGAAILSTGNGVVVHAGPAEGYGNMVEVAHANGVSTRYGHLSRITVSVGDLITTGQKLGALGNTGRSTGAHLHYETRIGDQAVNPIPFLQMGERLKMFGLNTSGKQM